MTRVLITGCRKWDCAALAERVLDRLLLRYGRTSLVIVHGAAPGADTAFDRAALAKRITRDPHPADWTGKGRAAGPFRNRIMVQKGAAFCLAVHPDLTSSKGTKDCVRQALEAGIPCYLIDSEDGEPRRIRQV